MEDPFKYLDGIPNVTDVDCLPGPPEAGSSQVQLMDEEQESIDMRGLDLLELEQACRRKEFDKIQAH